MKCFFSRRRTAHNSHLFNGQYIDPKALYMYYFDRLPSISYITELDIHAAYAFLREEVSIHTAELFQHSQYNYDTGTAEFNVTYIVLHRQVIIEVGADYVAFLHRNNMSDWVRDLLASLAAFRNTDTARAPIGFSTRQEAAN